MPSTSDTTHALIRVLLVAAAILAIGSLRPAHADAVAFYAGMPTGCGGYNAGGRDGAGNLYMPCTAGTVRIVAVDGTSRNVAISHPVSRIAPSPDGRYLYSIQENWSGRFVRQLNGSYVRDAAFAFQRPDAYVAGGWPICGWGVATDGYGDVYLSTGGWCTSANRILKYSPDGSLLTSFGDWGASAIWEFRINGTGAICAVGTANCRQVLKENRVGSLPGRFNANFNIAVTHDGGRVWVADNNNMRVQWFDRIGGAEYVFGGMWNGEGAMFPASVMGSTYGIAVDPWGNAYVAATTRQEIWRLDGNGSNPVLVGTGTSGRPHTLAVDARGSVWVGEWGMRFDRADPVRPPLPVLPPKPAVDRDPPVLSRISAPSTTTTATIRVRLDATDDVGLAQMRIADGSGVWLDWRTFEAEFELQLSDGLGYKTIYVQVRDAARRESETRSVGLLLAPVPDTTAPTLSVGTPAPTSAPTIDLAVTSSDAVGVTHVRVAGNDGNFGPWTPWQNGTRPLRTVLESDASAWTRYVQVRDAAWNESPTVAVSIVRPAPPSPSLVEPIAGMPVAPGPSNPAAAAVDRVAPRLVSFAVPARSCSRRVLLTIVARDDVEVTHVRTANEDGRLGGWKPLRGGRIAHLLTKGMTHKVIYVQVRDAAGNSSRVVPRRSRLVRC